MSFTATLEIAVEVAVGKAKPVRFPGGRVRELELALTPHGLSGSVGLWVYHLPSQGLSDELRAPFAGQEPWKVTVELGSALRDQPPLRLSGLVSTRAVREEGQRDDGPHLRHYRLAFEDPAALLWRQHYPCELHVGSTWKSVLAKHTGDRIRLAIDDWEPLEHVHPILALSLGANRAASFHDLVCWLAATRDGHFTYDPVEDLYRLGGKRPKAPPGEPARLTFTEVADLTIERPEVERFGAKVLNATAVDAETRPVTRPLGLLPIRQDVVVRLGTTAELDAAQKAEEARAAQRDHEVAVTYARLPETARLLPGARLRAEEAHPGGWHPEAFHLDRVYRVIGTRLEARSAELPDRARQADSASFQVELTSRLEPEAEVAARLPAHRAPAYPFQVEGLVVSEAGTKEQLTYQVYEDEAHRPLYRVKVPLFETQKPVVVPFEPNLFSGHFYFPLYKGERVLLALDLHDARIERCLDWRPGARLPQESQANHLLLGNGEKDHASLQCRYVDGKPVFSVSRLLERDGQRLELSEGRLVLDVAEGEG